MKKKFTHVSLFSGAGGLDIGFEKAGLHTIWANDIDHDACETYKMWSDAIIVEGDISTIDFEQIPKSDIISGGFPCQGFSMAGPRKIDDSRNILYHHFVRLVERKQPKIFVAENVRGILSLGGGKIVDSIVSDFSNKGYNVNLYLVNASDYGVPQDRIRVIFIGIRKDLGVSFQFPKSTLPKVNLKDAIGDMPKPDISDVCMDAYSSRYMSRNRKRNWEQQSFTIPAMAKQVPLHPESPDMIQQDREHWLFGEGLTRRLSYKEAAIIQTFPKEIQFFGNLRSKYKQIGNAVPVKLAEVIGRELHQLLCFI